MKSERYEKSRKELSVRTSFYIATAVRLIWMWLNENEVVLDSHRASTNLLPAEPQHHLHERQHVCRRVPRCPGEIVVKLLHK
jgi:hypothetical protein